MTNLLLHAYRSVKLAARIDTRRAGGQPATVGRPSNTQERRAQIVDALLSTMAREGYERATVAAVAREAALTPGLLHYHFATKREILIALIERLAAGLEERLTRRLALAGDDAPARLFACIDAHVAQGRDADPRAVAAWIVVAAEAVRDSEVRALYTDAIVASLGRLRAMVLECLRAQGRVTRNAGKIAAALLSAIEGAYLLGTAAPGTLPEGFAAPTIRRMAEGLLVAEPRA